MGAAAAAGWLGTFFWLCVYAVGFGVIQFTQREEKKFKHTLYGTAVFCCFLTWWIVYIAQINTEIFIAPSNPFTNLTFLNVSKDL